MANPMEQIIVTTVDALHDLSDTVAAIDRPDVDSLARLRLIQRAHRQIKEMLGQHAHLVYCPEDTGQHELQAFTAYRSAEH
jgi:hypothetical protein